MAFVPRNPETTLSDLLFHENDPCVGVAREDINVTAETDYQMGSVVFRALTELDPFAEYAPLTLAAQVAVENEFAVVIGNQYQAVGKFTSIDVTGETFNAVALKRGLIQLKEGKVFETLPEVVQAVFPQLKEILKRQGVILELEI